MRVQHYFAGLLMLLTLVSFGQDKFPYVYSTDSINKGISLHDEEKYEEAIKLYNYVLPGDTNYEWAVYEKCLSLVSNEQYEQGIEIAQRELQLKNENEGLFYNLLGTSYDELDKTEKAIEVYTAAIERFPMDYNLYYNRALVYDKMDQIDNAYADFKRAVEINPYHPSSHLALANLALNEEQYAQALLAFGFYLTLEPTGDRANSNLVQFNNAVSDKIELKPREFTFESENDFKKINLLITSYASLRKDYKTPSDIDLPIIKQLHLAIDQSVKIKKRKGFWENYYLPFYDVIIDRDLFEPFSYRLLASSGSDKHQKILKKNLKDIKAYIGVLGPKIKEIYGVHHENYDETKPEIKYWFRDGSESVEAVGKVNDDNNPVGPYKFYYNSGSLSSEGVFNDNGERNDKWTYYHTNGSIAGTNIYKDGKLDGADIDYFENGQKSLESAFKDDLRHGVTSVYNQTGDLNRSMYHNNGKIDDSLVYYYTNQQVDYKLPMKEGIIDGKVNYYRADGSISSYYTWKEDQRDGPFEGYFLDAKVSEKGNYKNGKVDGDYVSYYPNGKIEKQGKYVEGTRVGKWEEFYYDGKPLETAVYDERGKTTGIRETYDYNGHKTTTFDYLKGEVISYRHYDRNGEVMHEDKRKKGQFLYKNYTLDGVLNTSGYYAGDHKEGEWKYYTDNGVLTLVENYNTDGQLHGELKSYHINGQLKRHTTYKNDTLQGYDVEYYDNGTIREHGYNWNGKSYGTWKKYYKDGTPSSVVFYVNGRYNGPQYWYNEAGELYMIEYYDMSLLLKSENFNSDSVIYKTHIVERPNGAAVRHYPNGQKKYEIPLAGDEFQGKAKWWYGTGQIETEGEYLTDQRHGEWKWYYPNGKLRTVGTYAFGVRTGEWKGLHENGKPRSIDRYENGELHGEALTYDGDGNLDTKTEYFQGEKNGKRYFYDYHGTVDHIRFYDQGRIIGYSYLGSDGKEVEMIPIAKETGEITSYFPNGKVSRKYELKNGMFVGDYYEYNPDGSKRYFANYENNNRNGKSSMYYSTGKIRNEYTYKDGDLHGEFTEYHKNGKVKRKGTYLNDDLHGIVEEYDVNGKLMNKYEYNGGSLYEKK